MIYIIGLLFVLTMLIVVLFLRSSTCFGKVKTLDKEMTHHVEALLKHNAKLLDVIEAQNQKIILLDTKYKRLYTEVFGINEQDTAENIDKTKFTDATAQKLWDFLKLYIHDAKIPVFRVEDALNMINADKIEYSEC